MSIDALALLRIKELAAPNNPMGVEVHVTHRGDASIISTWTRFDSHTPDEFSLALRKQLGSALDAHDDERGILFFPDLCEYRGRSYAAIVKEVETAGFWAPIVGEDHVPARYTAAAPGTHDALVARMIERMGRDAATAFDLLSEVYQIQEGVNANPDDASQFAAHLAELEGTMGADFAASYRASLTTKVADDRARQERHLESMRELGELVERGTPLVTDAEIGTFIDEGGADAIFANLDAKTRKALERQLGALDADGLPDGDLGKQLAKALKRTKK